MFRKFYYIIYLITLLIMSDRYFRVRQVYKIIKLYNFKFKHLKNSEIEPFISLKNLKFKLVEKSVGINEILQNNVCIEALQTIYSINFPCFSYSYDLCVG